MASGGSDSLMEYRSGSSGDFRTLMRAEEVLREVLAERRLQDEGLDPGLIRALRFPFRLRPVQLTEGGGAREGGVERLFLSAYVFILMLFSLIATSGQLLVRSVIEEKAGRVVEVLVSSCSSTELMAGKVLGLSALGFTQIVFWGLAAAIVGGSLGVRLIEPSHAFLLAAYFILGYLFYAGVFIALGSPLSTEQEAQQVNTYLVLLLLVPIVLALPAIQDPDAEWIRVLSYVPFLTPTLMALRIPVRMPSAGDIAGTMLTMAAAICCAMWVAGRIFRVAVLATGKRPTIREIARWITCP
ncbi:MAG: ABC transporter permease [Bacteroidota bacterium]